MSRMLVPAIASISLGRSSAGHDLLTKIRVAKLAGFEGIEIFFECLEHLALQKGASPATTLVRPRCWMLRTRYAGRAMRLV